MNLKNLIKKTLERTVNKSDGISDTIDFVGADGAKKQYKAIVEYPEYDKGNDDTIQATMVFHGVSLDVKPKKGDVVIWENNRYIVEHFKDVVGIYDLYCIDSKLSRSRF